MRHIYRSKLSDDLSSATLHLQDLRDLHDIEVLESSGVRTLDLHQALRYVENGLDDLRNKYLGAKITKPFFDEAQQKVRGYAGEVTSIDFSTLHGCYLFRAEYESDSDTEEMELWELHQFI